MGRVKLTLETKNTMIAEPEKSFKKTETLRFHSFDGGGPSYTLTVEDLDVGSY